MPEQSFCFVVTSQLALKVFFFRGASPETKAARAFLSLVTERTTVLKAAASLIHNDRRNEDVRDDKEKPRLAEMQAKFEARGQWTFRQFRLKCC